MRCYNCNSVLSDTDYCTSCGTDVSIYKMIVKMSNTYYNIGLEKARARDLTGAADILRRSVRLNKHNIKARNLLGLVYYEMGNCVEAFSEWVISKNIKPEKNIVDKYLEDIQENPAKLELINQTAKKYNKALEYAKEGNDDLAIIQLKRLISLAPNFINAEQLLGLLYIKNGDNDKAKKVLLKTLKVDVNNTLTLKYLAEIDGIERLNNAKSNKKQKKEEEERPALSGNDVILPKSSYREGSSAAVNIINVLVGIVLGAAMIFFLVTPAREKAVKDQYNDKINDYSAKIATNNITVNSLNQKITELEAQNDTLNKSLQEKSDEASKGSIYDALLLAASDCAKDDFVACATKLDAIKVSDVSTTGFQSAYASLVAKSYPQASLFYLAQANTFMSASKITEAIADYETAFRYDSTNADLVFRMARAYRAANGYKLEENSKKYFKMVVSMVPDTDLANSANEFLAGQ